MISFTELLKSAAAGEGTCTIDVPEDWGMGRSTFGGLQVVLALLAMRTRVPDLPLRTLQTTFIAPVPIGPASARAQVLRTGKNTVHVEARIVNGEETLAIVIGVFGASRTSAVDVMPEQEPVANPRPIPFRFMPGITPNFTQHFASTWLSGTPPFTGDTLTRHVIETGMKDPGPVTENHVLAIADFMPPVALSLLKKPAPGSSMTWMIELLVDRFDALPPTGWRVDSELVAGKDGYTSQSVMIWGPGGVPVAISRQNMVIFG
jgi:hypothetical protein